MENWQMKFAASEVPIFGPPSISTHELYHGLGASYHEFSYYNVDMGLCYSTSRIGQQVLDANGHVVLQILPGQDLRLHPGWHAPELTMRQNICSAFTMWLNSPCGLEFWEFLNLTLNEQTVV